MRPSLMNSGIGYIAPLGGTGESTIDGLRLETTVALLSGGALAESLQRPGRSLPRAALFAPFRMRSVRCRACEAAWRRLIAAGPRKSQTAKHWTWTWNVATLTAEPPPN